MSRLPATILLCALIAVPAAAQQKDPAAEKSGQGLATLDEVMNELITLARRTIEDLTKKGIKPTLPFSGAVSSMAGGPILTFLAGRVVDREAYKTLTDVLAISSATQIGSTSDSGGSTSVAMKGLVPAILGFAVEHGAITQDVNDTVATFRVSPAGIVKTLQGKGLLDIYQDYSREPGYRFASRFSGAVSFDTSLGDSPGTLLANEQQLTAWSVTVTLLNHRDPRAKGYGREWRALANQQGAALIATRAALDDALGKWSTFTIWQEALTERVRREVDEPWRRDGNIRAATARFKAILESALPALSELSTSDPSVNAAMSAYVAQLTMVVEARNDIYAYANEGAIGTFDWTTTRDENLPDLYTLTGVYENSFTRSRKDDFTANAALRFFRQAPSGGDRRFKDFSLSAQWDRPLGRVFEIPFILSAAARYQFIPEDIPVPAGAVTVPETVDGTGAPAPRVAGTASGTAIAPKGHLILGQGKLTIPLKNGVRIPLSVTFANRTELIEEEDVRANFGVTFNLDAFIAAFKAR
jgi:hypothetical protein